MDTENVVPTHNRMLFSRKKEGNADTCYDMSESWARYTKWNKPVTKGQIQCSSTDMSYPERWKSQRKKVA